MQEQHPGRSRGVGMGNTRSTWAARLETAPCLHEYSGMEPQGSCGKWFLLHHGNDSVITQTPQGLLCVSSWNHLVGFQGFLGGFRDPFGVPQVLVGILGSIFLQDCLVLLWNICNIFIETPAPFPVTFCAVWGWTFLNSSCLGLNWFSWWMRRKPGECVMLLWSLEIAARLPRNSECVLNLSLIWK